MRDSLLSKQEIIETPAFIYDLDKVREKAKFLYQIKKKVNCKILYSVKALPLYRVLKEIEPFVDGFSVSSFFEAKLIEKVYKGKKEIHFVSPSIKSEQWEAISDTTTHLTFNSLEQFSFFKDRLQKKKNYAVRINPEISFAKDARYDPCSKFSKLGTPINGLKKKIYEDPSFLKEIQGIHLHTNCESEDFSHLIKTFLKLKTEFGAEISKFQSINLGGGYLFDTSKNLSLFYELVNELNENYNFDIIIEPGGFLVKDSGYLLSSVIDLFQRNGKKIAILDTTVNHLPEVFEYQYEPDVYKHMSHNKNEYILAGCSCLAGDVFGTYCFENELSVGSKVFFEKVGSYSLVKAHTFNGINLPDIYCLEDSTGLEKVKSFTFEEYVSHYRS